MSGLNSSAVNQRICEKLVQREVLHCISQTVDFFAKHPEAASDVISEDELMDLCTRHDYETAAYEHVRNMDIGELIEFANDNGIYLDADNETPFPEEYEDADFLRKLIDEYASDDYQEFCNDNDVDLDGYDIEAYEHWAVTSWFKARLAEHGQITGDLLDFDVWGRCTTGQAISMDGVIAEIANEMEILEGQKNSWAD